MLFLLLLISLDAAGQYGLSNKVASSHLSSTRVQHYWCRVEELGSNPISPDYRKVVGWVQVVKAGESAYEESRVQESLARAIM